MNFMHTGKACFLKQRLLRRNSGITFHFCKFLPSLSLVEDRLMVLHASACICYMLFVLVEAYEENQASGRHIAVNEILLKNYLHTECYCSVVLLLAINMIMELILKTR